MTIRTTGHGSVTPRTHPQQHPHTDPMRIRLAAAAVAVAATLTALTACSSDDSSDKAAAPPAAPATATAAADASIAALVKSVTDYTAELFNGDASGYRLLSARCKRQMSKAAWTQLAKQGHHDYGSQKATGIHVDQLSGDLARVTYGAGNIPAMERKGQPWAREDGTWRWDACQSDS